MYSNPSKPGPILLEKYPLGWAIGLSVLFLAVFKLLSQSSFETNDDALFSMFCSGFYTGQPYEYLIASSILVGLLLKQLYLAFPEVSWYGIYLTLGHFLAYVGFFYVLVKYVGKLHVILAFWAILLLFEGYFLAYIQFTTTAFMCSLAGYFLWMNIKKNEIDWFAIFYGLFLIGCGICIRPVHFGFLTAIFFPVFLLKSWIDIRWRPLLLVGMAVGLYFSLEAFDSNFQGSFVHWKQYKNYFNNEFHGLADAPQVAFKKPLDKILLEVGWSKNDYELMKEGFFEDTTVYSIERCKKIFYAYQEGRTWLDFNQTSALFALVGRFKYHAFLSLGLFLLGFFIVKDTLRRLFMVGTLVMLVALTYYMGTFTIYKSRILVPSWLALILVCFYYKSENTFPKWFQIKWLKSGLIGVILFLYVKIYINQKENIGPRIKNYMEEWVFLEKQFPNKTLVAWSTSLPFDNVDIVNSTYTSLSSTKIYYLDWLSGFPAQHKSLAYRNATSVYEGLLTPDFLLIVDNSLKYRLDHLVTYYKEHFGQNVRMEPVVSQMDNGVLLSYTIYKVVRN